MLAGACRERETAPLLVRVWEVATGKERRYLQTTATGQDAVLAFSPDGRFLAIGAEEVSGLQVWDLATGREVARFRGYEGAIWSLAFAPGGERLASGLGHLAVQYA
jgi:WD40 repeat protein